MSAFNMDNGRHGNGRTDRLEAMAVGSYATAPYKVTQSKAPKETAEDIRQRQERLAEATGTSRRLWL